MLSFYADISTSIKQELQDGEESFSHFQEAVIDSQELDPIHKLSRLDSKTEELKAIALRITHLLQYVSLNMQAIRKILKKFAKHVEPTKPAPGFLALEIQHPHEPGWKMMQVRKPISFCLVEARLIAHYNKCGFPILLLSLVNWLVLSIRCSLNRGHYLQNSTVL